MSNKDIENCFFMYFATTIDHTKITIEFIILVWSLDMEIKDVIARIGYFRNRANLSAKALSLSIDKNPAYINKMERGEYEPSMRVVLDIIEACGTTPEEFFSEDINSYKLDKETLTMIKKLNENKKIALKELLK